MATCALCGKLGTLRDSHIVPKFVIRYLKETAAGKIRNLEAPNRTVEDGEKHQLLCADCEELFSSREKYFADTVFYPYKKNKAVTFNYNERLFYFMTSLSWRSLYLDAQDENYPSSARLEMNAAIDSLRQFLLGRAPAPQQVENHLFFFDVAVSSTLTGEAANTPNVIMHRSITSYTVAANDDSSIFVFTNMMGIIVVTFIKRDENEIWENTKIVNGTGLIEAKKQKVKSIMVQEIKRMLEYSCEMQSSVSEKQQQAILQRIKAHGTGIQNFPFYQDWLDDRSLKQ